MASSWRYSIRPNFSRESRLDHHGMFEMEKTINDLQFATGLGPLEEDVPELMQTPPVQTVSAASRR